MLLFDFIHSVWQLPRTQASPVDVTQIPNTPASCPLRPLQSDFHVSSFCSVYWDTLENFVQIKNGKAEKKFKLLLHAKVFVKTKNVYMRKRNDTTCPWSYSVLMVKSRIQISCGPMHYFFFTAYILTYLTPNSLHNVVWKVFGEISLNWRMF